VQPDGYVTLRDVGDLHVEGETVPEITESVRTAYGKILHAPVISVVLKDFEKPHFIAGGELGHPGKYDLRSDTTVTEAIAIAGGFTEKAKHSQVLLFRRLSDEWTEVKTVNVKEILHTKAISEDIHLQPGDMLFVPTSLIANIKRIIPTPGTGIYFNPSQF
jgi:polysaccharide export outer membrane protein